MKAELRQRPHTNFPGHWVFEVLWNGQVIAEVTGADEPGIRIVTHDPIQMREQVIPGYTNVRLHVVRVLKPGI